MIGVLFGVNILLALGIGLTTAMLQNYFNKIEKSLTIYGNPKAYKPQSHIAFIDGLIEKFRNLAEADEEVVEPEYIIQERFSKEKIGVFSYQKVHRLATKGKVMVWGVLAIQMMIELMSKMPGQSISDFIYIVGSTLICMLITLIDVVKNVSEQKNKLVEKIKEYIFNTYPNELDQRHKQKAYQELMEKLDHLEFEPVDQEDKQEEWLAEEDIKTLLQELDKEA